MLLAFVCKTTSRATHLSTSSASRIYLPTLKSANACYPTPIVIGYTFEAVRKVGHFTALVGVCGELGYIPLVDECGVGLPVR